MKKAIVVVMFLTAMNSIHAFSYFIENDTNYVVQGTIYYSKEGLCTSSSKSFRLSAGGRSREDTFCCIDKIVVKRADLPLSTTAPVVEEYYPGTCHTDTFTVKANPNGSIYIE